MKQAAQKEQPKDKEQIIDMLFFSAGPHIREYLKRPDVVEIMLNPDGSLWVDVLGKGCENTGFKMTAPAAENVIKIVASSLKKTCNEKNPILSGELPGDGSRFEGILGYKVVPFPTFSIRKKALQVFSLDDYVSKGMLTETQKQQIENGVKNKKNFLIVGGTGSGKTTLANAVLKEISLTTDRIVLIEDTLELQCESKNLVSLRTTDEVNMKDLLKSTMRLRPDRIIVGEVRGEEALTLLKAWNTGHPGGVATVHANSAKGGLKRLEQLILEKEGMKSKQEDLIAEAIDIIVYIERADTSRKIKEIVLVNGFENDYILEHI